MYLTLKYSGEENVGYFPRQQAECTYPRGICRHHERRLYSARQLFPCRLYIIYVQIRCGYMCASVSLYGRLFLQPQARLQRDRNKKSALKSLPLLRLCPVLLFCLALLFRQSQRGLCSAAESGFIFANGLFPDRIRAVFPADDVLRRHYIFSYREEYKG